MSTIAPRGPDSGSQSAAIHRCHPAPDAIDLAYNKRVVEAVGDDGASVACRQSPMHLVDVGRLDGKIALGRECEIRIWIAISAFGSPKPAHIHLAL